LRHKHFLIASFLLVIMALVSASLFFPVVATETITLSPIADSYVDSDSPSANYGGDNSLLVDFWDYEYIEDVRRNSYLLFDLTTLDPDVFVISSATLEIHSYSAGSPTSQVGVHFCSNIQWNEIEMTWSNAPSFTSEPIDVTAVAFDDTWYSFDVTEEVRNSQECYLALVLTVESEGESFHTNFDSKEFYKDNPRLVIEHEATQEPPVASFTYSPPDPQVNDTITFDASGSSDTDGTIVSYLWDFGDGETSTSQNPTHAYNQEGSYNVTLTITDNDGLTDTATATIADIVIPEFPSWTITLVALSFVAVTGIIYKKKLCAQ
jgi:hypothetical protein